MRINIYNDRHRAAQNALDDILHQVKTAAGCVELQDEQLGAALLRLADAALQVLGHRRCDRPIRSQLKHQGCILLGRGRSEEQQSL